MDLANIVMMQQSDSDYIVMMKQSDWDYIVMMKQSDWDYRVNTIVKGVVTVDSTKWGSWVSPTKILENIDGIWCVLTVFIV